MSSPISTPLPKPDPLRLRALDLITHGERIGVLFERRQRIASAQCAFSLAMGASDPSRESCNLKAPIMLMKTYSRLLGLLAVGMLGVSAFPVGAAEVSYKFLKEIPIGGEGGWDYLSVDQDARRLYVSHATKVVVIDIDKDAVVGEVADTPGVHGIAIAPKLGLGFASNGRENKASIFDLKTLKTTSKVDTGENPDCILYDQGPGRFIPSTGARARRRCSTPRPARSWPPSRCPASRNSPALAPEARRIYYNLEDKSAGRRH